MEKFEKEISCWMMGESVHSGWDVDVVDMMDVEDGCGRWGEGGDPNVEVLTQ